NLGWKVLRSVTTHRTDDNKALCEVSAVESIDTSVRAMRANLRGKLGDKVLGATAKKMAGLVETELDRQVDEKIIKAWRNVVVDDLGDTFRIGVELAPVLPLNFIIYRPTLV